MPRQLDPEVQSLATFYGWEQEPTGGGCDALWKDIPDGDGSYWLITEEGGCSIPPDANSPVMLGTYRADGEATEVIPATFPNLLAAMLYADHKATRQ